ncbi:MAG: RagB/SusD family nutrient uptake outer membrane protein [Prevotella sp.]|nr:RagB/SusD family nutrient uptake outer membrane protein [Prevotella sp.]MDY4037838.1 RagB/SusD family nutrient uptake outer membrane protein [Prevotella sp.]
MEKKIFCIFALALTMGLNSCDDYLTQASPDELTSQSFWRDAADVESALASAYSQMYLMDYTSDMWTFSEVNWPVLGYRGDDVIMGNDAMNYSDWVDLYNFTYTNGNSQFTNLWRHYYTGVSFCNQILDKTEAMTESQLSGSDKKRLQAEAHFLRGYYDMILLLNWERIIVRDHYITSGEASALDKEVSPRPEAWDFIIKDFKEAAEGLPQEWDADNAGRATSGAAYAYMGWAYLTRAYEEPDKKSTYLQAANDAFDGVKGYELSPDFYALFNGGHKNSKESIFELQFSFNDANGALYRTQAHRWIGCSELMGWDEILPSKSLMAEFMKEGKISMKKDYDSRLYATVFFQCDYFNDGTGKVYGQNYDDVFQNDDGPYNRPAFRKFMPATFEELSLSSTAINIPLMRYANVMLMKAEALNGLGQTTQAIPLINEVRRVHGDMPPMTGTSATDVQKQIEHEREIEFPLENFRWYDLRRWGKTAQVLSAVGRSGYTEDKSFYPIPQTELNSNGALKNK